MNSLTLSPVRAAFNRMSAYLAAYENGDTKALDALDRIDLSLASAVEEEVLFLENLDAQLERAQQAIKIAKERVKALENLRERSGNNLIADMCEQGLDEVEGLTKRAKVMRNGGVPALELDLALGTIDKVLSEEDADSVPDHFVERREVAILNLRAVREHLQTQDLPWARLAPRGRHLAFRPL